MSWEMLCGHCLMHIQFSQQEGITELADTSVELVLLLTIRLPVSLGCPPPSGNMTVSCKMTCHLFVFAFDFAWSKGVHLHQRQLINPAFVIRGPRAV